jgi:hypothetical protein
MIVALKTHMVLLFIFLIYCWIYFGILFEILNTGAFKHHYVQFKYDFSFKDKKRAPLAIVIFIFYSLTFLGLLSLNIFLFLNEFFHWL